MADTKISVSTKDAPAAIGPYSQAVRVGEMVFTSGQVAMDPVTGWIVPGEIGEQTTRVMENLKAVLAAAGLTLADVVKTTVFLKSMDDFGRMNAVYAKYLAPEGVVPPARSTVEVARLPKDALVEIEVIAKGQGVGNRETTLRDAPLDGQKHPMTRRSSDGRDSGCEAKGA